MAVGWADGSFGMRGVGDEGVFGVLGKGGFLGSAIRKCPPKESARNIGHLHDQYDLSY